MYIEREAALAALSMAVANAEYDECEEETVKKCMRVLHKVPAADVAPVVHGEWYINSDGYYPYCSECKNEPKGGEMTDYCPNCGAKMDGGSEK